MAKILISGGSGLIGKALTERLLQNKHEVVWLSRNQTSFKDVKSYKWDWTKNEIDENAFDGVDVVINLAGSGIVDKAWTNSYKQTIIDSRIKSSELILSVLKKNNIQLKTFIGASAVGFYGSDISEKTYDENSQPGNDFMANTCVKWENSYLPFKEYCMQLVIFRIGVVITNKGGALPKMILPFKLGIGSALGTGKQYLPWIHLSDLIRLFLYTIEQNQMNGTYNAVSTQIITNREFSEELAKSIKRPFFFPKVPTLLLKLILGERHLTITRGLKVSNQKILNTGFVFQYPQITMALNELSGSKTI